MGKIEGGPQGHRWSEAQTPVSRSTRRRVITGAELAGRKASNPLWKDARFLVEWKDREGRLHTAGNYRITRGRSDGTTETVRHLDSPSLRDIYADVFGGETVLRQVHDGEDRTVDRYGLILKGNGKRRREGYENFVRTAREDGYRIRRCEIDLASSGEGSGNDVSLVTFFVHRCGSGDDDRSR